MGDAANKRITDENANHHTDLRELSSVGLSFVARASRLKIPESVMGGKDIEIVFGMSSAMRSR